MKKAVFSIRGLGPIVFGAPVHEEKRDDETHAQLEERTWRRKAHSVDGKVCISSRAVHRSLVAAGSWLSMKLDKNKTYTKRLASGIMCTTGEFFLTKNGEFVSVDDLDRYDIYVPSDGKKGGTKRVWRTFPRLMPSWEMSCDMVITDESITEDILARHLKSAGLHDGLGSMRIGTGGPNGMWTLEDIQLDEYSIE